MKIVKKIVEKIEQFMNGFERIICSSAMVLTIVVVIVNVTRDLVFKTRSSASEEWASIGYIWVTYASMGYLYRRKDLMEVSFVTDALPRVPKHFADILREMIIIAFGVAMCYFGIKLCEGGFVKRLVATQIPYVYIDAALVLGFFSQTFSCLVDLVKDIIRIPAVIRGDETEIAKENA